MNNYKFEAAQRYSHQGFHNKAIDTLKELLADDPNNAIYHGLLSANLLAKGRVYAAEYELKIALNIDPAVSYFYLVMARICIFKKNLKQAFDSCNEALALNVESAEAFLIKSNIYQMLDKRKESLECIQNAAQCEPESIDVAVAFGEFYLAQNNFNKADKFVRDALHEDAQDEDANLLMGNLQLKLGNIEEAEYHAKFVILQNPENQAALRLFSNIKLRKNILFGLWWRFNSKVASLSNVKSSLVLISAFLIFSVLSQIIGDLGYDSLAKSVSYTWLILVIYSWIGIPYYNKTLKKELEKFSFNPHF